MVLLNFKISNLQCYCASFAMVILKTLQSQLEEVLGISQCHSNCS